MIRKSKCSPTGPTGPRSNTPIPITWSLLQTDFTLDLITRPRLNRVDWHAGEELWGVPEMISPRRPRESF